MKNIMYYEKPAASWEEGNPIGNGRIGAMVIGNCQKEVLALNEDTLWSGYPTDYTDERVYSYLEKVRRDSKLSYDRSLDRILPANGRSWN